MVGALRWSERSAVDRLLVRAFTVLFTLVAVLIVANIFPVPPFWNLGQEGSLPTFVHSAILATVALLFWSVSIRGWRDPARARIKYLPVWLLAGVGFLYLSMSEAIELHERGSRLVFEYFGIQESIDHYRVTPALWEAVFAPVFIAIGGLILVVLFQGRHRIPAAFWLGLTAIGFWALALITEFFEMTYFVHMGRYWFGAAIWVEESSELLGSSLFLLAVALIARVLFAQPAPLPPAFDGPADAGPRHQRRLAQR